MKYLQANDYTKVNVGLKTAPNLIRQKASFGTELSDQAHELARILVGLRLVLLSALGIGARELAGHEEIVHPLYATRLTLGTYSSTIIASLVTSPIPLPHGPSLTTTRSNNDRTHQTSRRTKNIRTTSPSSPPFHHRHHIPQSQTKNKSSLHNRRPRIRVPPPRTLVDSSAGLVSSL